MRQLFTCCLLSFSSLLFSGSLSAQPARSPSTLEKIQTNLYDLIDKDITSVNFAKGGMALTEAEKRNLRAVYNSVKDDSSVRRIVIASWADRAGISNGEKLSDAQISLADKRSEAIQKELNALGARNTEVHNMAKDANWLAQTFRTKDAELKSALKGETAANAQVEDIAKTLEAKGGPGKAVVIIQRETVATSTSR